MSENRAALLRLLTQQAQIMLQGSVSETFRTCGTPSCHCHQGHLHGPHTYLTFRKPDGKSSGVYVPVAARQRVHQGMEAWKRFWELAVELASDNRLRAVERWRKEGKEARRHHAAT
jgi:hypothetical protein